MTIRATWAFNGQTKTILGNWHRLWCLLFGPFYYLFKGMWLWAILSLITANGLVDRLPAVQSRNRAAALSPQGLGAEMTMSAPTQSDCYPSGTQRAVPEPIADADCMKRLSNLSPARTRQTDT